MFDIGSSELLLIVIVAVVVIGPKDLPRALYKVGQIVGKARGMARHFRTGIDAMVREVEMEELEKKWAEQNRRIMDEHPPETVQPAADSLAAPMVNNTPAHDAPFVAEPAPITLQPTVAPPPAAADGPPYLAEKPAAVSKGDSPA
ncbi:Sec-independent protein translocase protein TatB [Sphingobium bisphenolivorans]|uniref:Sec-independent protein translocase protein TatB n=1 Tax=Sphingobium bisphenolivorans TaxID=1335760 RepID=UPI0003A7B757|nr:Sec-independent protein translocase protein TatB [Sphingobium bisphenolivorans]